MYTYKYIWLTVKPQLNKLLTTFLCISMNNIDSVHNGGFFHAHKTDLKRISTLLTVDEYKKKAWANCGSRNFTTAHHYYYPHFELTQRIENYLPFFALLNCMPKWATHTHTQLTWLTWRDSEPYVSIQNRDAVFFLNLQFTLMLLTEHVINFKIGTLCIFHVYLKRFFLSLLFPLCMRNRFWWHTFMDAKKVITINTITNNRKKWHLKF